MRTKLLKQKSIHTLLQEIIFGIKADMPEAVPYDPCKDDKKIDPEVFNEFYKNLRHERVKNNKR